MSKEYRNAAGTHVLVYNPETDARWEAPPEALGYLQARGWELAEPVEEEQQGLVDTTAEGEEQTGFDPSRHTVAEVDQYLASHAEENPGEVERVLGLERAGKNRSTIAVPDGFTDGE